MMRHVVSGVVALLLSVPLCAQAPAPKPAPAAARPTAAKPAAPAAPAAQKREPVKTSPGAGAVIVIELAKGTVEIETYPADAPKTVEHILALVKRNFYNGQRVHRVAKGFVVQFGDPQSRDMTKRDRWGTGGSGRTIGVAEITKTRTHNLGAVAMAHSGDPKAADSQMYIALAPVHRLDGMYTVFGQVISGMDVVQRIEVNDVIRRVTIRAQAPAGK